MSAFPDHPSHFVDWLRTRADFADVPVADLREQFVPRRIFGDYLHSLLFWQAQPLGGTSRVHIDVNEDEAKALLLSIDPLAALAQTQDQIHERLLELTPKVDAALEAAWRLEAEAALDRAAGAAPALSSMKTERTSSISSSSPRICSYRRR
jgi:hypothetical protein